MPVRITTKEDAAISIRGRRSTVLQLAEYRDVMAKVSNGLKPEEVIEVSFPVSTKPGMKTILQTFKRTLQSDFRRLKLNDFEIKAFRLEDTNYVTVGHVPPITGLKQVPKKSAGAR
jgi:hypothetical protein